MANSRYNGITMLREATARHGIRLSVIVAEVALWASLEVYQRLLLENGSGTYFPQIRRCRPGAGERRRQICGDERLDDNTSANRASKQAIGVKAKNIIGFETCHIWPETCHDARYHTNIANLVLIPRPVAGLSDYDPETQAVLKFRAYELYGWHPVECEVPVRPEFYPNNWLEPMPFTSMVAKALASRRLDYLPSLLDAN